jgi:hypothetical protein
MSRRLILLLAASPLVLAGPAEAETVISTTVTTPVATSTAAAGARDDVRVASGGAVQPTGGTAITLDSDNAVTIEGAVKIQNADDAVGLRVLGGRRGEVKISGTITVDETAEPKDADNDGDLDGPLAVGARRHGVLVTGPGAFQGSIVQTGGAISVEGRDSAGVAVDTALQGSVRLGGAVGVTGDRAFGLRTREVSGDILVGGAVQVRGEGAVGLALDGDVGGRLVVGSTVTSTGFRATSRPADEILKKLDADDLLLGGPAVRIRGDVLGGVLIDAPPADLDPKDKDEDDDGVEDSAETTGLVSVFGSAPALAVGGADDLRLGRVGAGVDGYGLLIKGSVQAAGVYDGISATGVRLGGEGGRVVVDGGVRLAGSVSADAREASATALHLAAGAQAPLLASSGQIAAKAASAGEALAAAVRIDAGAGLSAISNSGSITAAFTGAKGSATAVLDQSGALRDISNSRLISAVVTPPSGGAAAGRAVALDLRANTQGVTVRQVQDADPKVAAAIIGDVLFGSGAARLELLAGSLTGDVAFGSGADTLVIGGGAVMSGALSDAGGGLAVEVGEGALRIANASSISLSSLRLGPKGEITFAVDPAQNRSTRLDVAGPAVLESGAKIGLSFTSKLVDPATFTLISAGDLSVGDVDPAVSGATPWLYKASLRVDAARDLLVADVRRRSASEAGLGPAQTAAYDAVFQAFDRDLAVRDALLSKTDESGFRALYDQFLPDFSGGLFHVLGAGAEAAGRAVAEAPGRLGPGLRAWTQEIAFLVRRDLDGPGGYQAAGFGLTGGFEAPDTALGALGVQASFLNASVDEKGAAAGETLDASVLSAGVYWRETAGGLTAALAVSGGYVDLSSQRSVVDEASGLSRESRADWSGATLAAHASLNYTFEAGDLFVRPQAAFDYLRLEEDSRRESGGGEAMDLEIEARSGAQAVAFAGATFGWRLGDEADLRWTPQVTLGWRQVGGDGPGSTTARFLSGGDAFTLAAPELEGGGAVARLALRGEGTWYDVGLEAGGEHRDGYEAYDARFVARFVF